MTAMERDFNPYDLNHIADIDKFIARWKERELMKLIHRSHPRPRTGLLKREAPPQQNETPQSDPDSTKP